MSIEIEPLSDEDNAILAKNDKILEELPKNIKIVVKGIDFDIKDHFQPDEADGFKQLWEILRDVLDITFSDDGEDYYYNNYPVHAQELRKFLEVMEKYMVEIDCVIERELSELENPKDLAFNLKQFCKDYLWGILNIMESNPNITVDEMNEKVIELDGYLKDSLLRRAGYDFDLADSVVYALSPEEKQKMDIENIPAEKKPSKQGEPNLPLGRWKFK